jgi:hypothetical protein
VGPLSASTFRPITLQQANGIFRDIPLVFKLFQVIESDLTMADVAEALALEGFSAAPISASVAAVLWGSSPLSDPYLFRCEFDVIYIYIYI